MRAVEGSLGHSPKETWRKDAEWENTHVSPMLTKQRTGWSLMIFYARATRGRRLPSLDVRTIGTRQVTPPNTGRRG